MLGKIVSIPWVHQDEMQADDADKDHEKGGPFRWVQGLGGDLLALEERRNHGADVDADLVETEEGKRRNHGSDDARDLPSDPRLPAQGRPHELREDEAASQDGAAKSQHRSNSMGKHPSLIDEAHADQPHTRYSHENGPCVP